MTIPGFLDPVPRSGSGQGSERAQIDDRRRRLEDRGRKPHRSDTEILNEKATQRTMIHRGNGNVRRRDQSVGQGGADVFDQRSDGEISHHRSPRHQRRDARTDDIADAQQSGSGVDAEGATGKRLLEGLNERQLCAGSGTYSRKSESQLTRKLTFRFHHARAAPCPDQPFLCNPN